MDHRLIKPISKSDRILKTRLLLGNGNKLVQVQPRCTEFRKFLFQSTVQFPHEPSIVFDNSVQPQTGNNDGTMEGNGNVEKKNNAAARTRNQNSKFEGNNGGGWDGKKYSRGHVFDEDNVATKYFLFFTIVGFSLWWCPFNRRSNIEWEHFVDNYLARGRVVKLEVVDKKWLQAQLAPGTSHGKASTVWVKIDNVEPHVIIGALTKVVESTGKQMKVQFPDVDQKFELSLRTPFILMNASI